VQSAGVPAHGTLGELGLGLAGNARLRKWAAGAGVEGEQKPWVERTWLNSEPGCWKSRRSSVYPPRLGDCELDTPAAPLRSVQRSALLWLGSATGVNARRHL
jgi:hypothetical protein